MKRILIPLLSLFALIGTGMSFFLFVSRPKTACVDLAKIYNGFELKKQLETQLNVVQQVRQKTLDSLELSLKMFSRNLQSMETEKEKPEFQMKANEFDLRKQDFLYKQKSYSEDNSTLTRQFDQQIWKQLNQYVKDYGDMHGYTYILGGDGTGSMMYSSKGQDITVELITYTNERFKGETKRQ